MPKYKSGHQPWNIGQGRGWVGNKSTGGTGRVYLRHTRRDRWRMWYVHRVVVAKALLESGWLGWDRVDPDRPIPPGMHVDHVDGRPDHNCLGNLLLLQDVIHNRVSRWHKQYLDREASRQWDEENREWLEDHGIVW